MKLLKKSKTCAIRIGSSFCLTEGTNAVRYTIVGRQGKNKFVCRNNNNSEIHPFSKKVIHEAISLNKSSVAGWVVNKSNDSSLISEINTTLVDPGEWEITSSPTRLEETDEDEEYDDDEEFDEDDF